MDNEYFLDAGLQPPMPTWQSLSLVPELNCSPEQSPNCFVNPTNWNKSTDQFAHFESALSSIVSSPATSNSAMSNDAFAIRELIGKLGNICNSGEISPAMAACIGGGGGGNNHTTNETSCYNTPLNSPPKIHLPNVNHFVTENLPNLGNSMPIHPILPSLSADPGFAERAAKFSSFGSRSFSGRTTQFGSNNVELPYRSSPLMGATKLQRISSSPVLKEARSPMGIQENKNSTQTQMENCSGNGLVSALDNKFANSNEESSVSEQIPKTPNDMNSRKRKSSSRGKAKEIAANATKVVGEEDDTNSKRYKSTESEKGVIKTEEETKGSGDQTGDEDQKHSKENRKLPEPPKDYIHVRARRGQATDSHSLAERVRREKISERMKLLQDLVPNCNKVTGKALMLDEIINYVQSLQRQVEFLSMKLATVKPSLDFSIDTLLSKEGFQPNGSLQQQQMYQLGSSASAFYAHQSSQVNPNVTNGSLTMVDPLDTTLCRTIGINEFGHALPQGFSEDDLQSIVQMGFGPNPNPNSDFHSQNYPSE